MLDPKFLEPQGDLADPNLFSVKETVSILTINEL